MAKVAQDIILRPIVTLTEGSKGIEFFESMT
jgi:hypothetical protein